MAARWSVNFPPCASRIRGKDETEEDVTYFSFIFINHADGRSRQIIIIIKKKHTHSLVKNVFQMCMEYVFEYNKLIVLIYVFFW